MRKDPHAKIGSYAVYLCAARLDRMNCQVGAALESNDPDSVHDRRFVTVLKEFRLFFPQGKIKKIRKRLGAVMGLSSAVRDRDIALELGRRAGIPADSVLLERFAEQRGEAGHVLAAHLQRIHERNIPRWRGQLDLDFGVRRTESGQGKTWTPTATAVENAEIVLPALAQRIFRDGRKAAKSSSIPERLHSFRLKVKRFRYTIELFQSCYGSGLEKRLRSLKRLQDYLGALSDLDTTAGLLTQARLRDLPEQKGFRQFLESQLSENTEGFMKHWRADFDAPGQERRWTTYLKSRARKLAQPKPPLNTARLLGEDAIGSRKAG